MKRVRAPQWGMVENPVMVRYIDRDGDEAIASSTKLLGFTVVMHPVAGPAILERGNLRLALTKPGGRSGGDHNPRRTGDLSDTDRAQASGS